MCANSLVDCGAKDAYASPRGSKGILKDTSFQGMHATAVVGLLYGQHEQGYTRHENSVCSPAVKQGVCSSAEKRGTFSPSMKQAHWADNDASDTSTSKALGFVRGSTHNDDSQEARAGDKQNMSLSKTCQVAQAVCSSGSKEKQNLCSGEDSELLAGRHGAKATDQGVCHSSAARQDGEGSAGSSRKRLLSLSKGKRAVADTEADRPANLQQREDAFMHDYGKPDFASFHRDAGKSGQNCGGECDTLPQQALMASFRKQEGHVRERDSFGHGHVRERDSFGHGPQANHSVQHDTQRMTLSCSEDNKRHAQVYEDADPPHYLSSAKPHTDAHAEILAVRDQKCLHSPGSGAMQNSGNQRPLLSAQSLLRSAGKRGLSEREYDANRDNIGGGAMDFGAIHTDKKAHIPKQNNFLCVAPQSHQKALPHDQIWQGNAHCANQGRSAELLKQGGLKARDQCVHDVRNAAEPKREKALSSDIVIVVSREESNGTICGELRKMQVLWCVRACE